MTHQVHPFIFRIGINTTWRSRWFQAKKYREYLREDTLIREWLTKKLKAAHIDAIEIERSPTSLNIIIKTAKPGILIGRGGEGAEKLKQDITKRLRKMTPRGAATDKRDLKLMVEDIKTPETHAAIVARMVADDLEKQQEFGSKVKGALIYPAIIVVGMVVVSFIMMIFVIPRLTSLYIDFGATLPLPTQILIGVSNFFVNFWYVVIIVAGLGIYLFILYRATATGRRKVDEMIFKIPIFGELQRQVILTELTRTLSLMVGAGVSILEALNITSEVVGNSIISEALKDASKQVEKGFPIAFSFARHPDAFPFLLSQMIAVGEETGKMEEVLNKISHIYEVESDERVKGLTAAVEPLVMVLLGLGVGFLVIAVILPIYNLTSQF